MKTTLKLILLTFIAVTFSSCCGLFKQGTLEGEREVTRYRTIEGTKGNVTIPETTTQKVTYDCYTCGSYYCPKPQCCGIVSKSVLSRATGQTGTGEPSIGLIPTMKTLAPDKK